MDGTLARKVIIACLPVAFLSTLTSSVSTSFNTIIVSETIGDAALTIVTSSSVYTIILSSIASILTVAGTISFTRHKAQGNREAAASCFTLTLILAVLGGILYLLGCHLFGPAYEPPLDQMLKSDYVTAVSYTAIPLIINQIMIAHLWIDDDRTLSLACVVVFILTEPCFAEYLYEDYLVKGIGAAPAISALLAIALMSLHLRKKNRYLRIGKPMHISSDARRMAKTILRTIVT